MRYKLIENGRVLHSSGDLGKLINFTANTTNAEIHYGDRVIWVQRPDLYFHKPKWAC